MSAAVICDSCGAVIKKYDGLHCADAVLGDGEMVYGADLCDKCHDKFDFTNDVYGWHATSKKGGAE